MWKSLVLTLPTDLQLVTVLRLAGYEPPSLQSWSRAEWFISLGSLKKHLADKNHAGDRDVKGPVTFCLQTPDTHFFCCGVQALVQNEEKVRTVGNAMKICFLTSSKVGRDSAVGIATRYRLDGPGIESRWRRDFQRPSRPVLGPTQPPLQWLPGLTRGVKRPGHGVDPHPAPKLKKV